MLVSVLRFILRGWVTELYVEPGFYFTFYGFEWVKPLGPAGMNLVFAVMALTALGICLGAFYRISAPLFFLTFTYVELLDKTNYLNHYYFVSLVAFLLVLVPAHRYRSLDILIWPSLKQEKVPRWTIGLFRLQLGMVYFFAGVAKLNSDWLLRAMPLKIWLPAQSHLPVIGGILKFKWAAYLFSWGGALYDLVVPFALSWKKTRWLAYIAVIGFHAITSLLFPIGMFPLIMILSTLIFFSEEFHREVPGRLIRLAGKEKRNGEATWEETISGGESGGTSPLRSDEISPPRIGQKIKLAFIGAFLLIQLLLPFRYLLYPGQLFWTEQGYRFSWRVMLMEKAGTATFYIRDPETGRESEVDNAQFLTPNQEKMMSTQPDMILQYAHYLAEKYEERGINQPFVRAEVFVTLNGSGSRPFIDPQVNLAEVEESWGNKTWILPFEK